MKRDLLWYKAWLDTRWRFLIGLALLVCAAMATVLMRPRLMQLLPAVSTIPTSGELGRKIQESAALVREYRGYIWTQWFRQTPTQLGTLMAILLGTGGLLSQSSGGGLLFTLSLPVSRQRLLGVRAAAGLAEWLALAIVPSLVVPLISPAIGESYGIGAAVVHGVCLFVGGAVFFSLAFFLSTMFEDMWRPLLIALTLAIALSVAGEIARELSPYSVFAVMNGETYFRTGHLPWIGLLVSAAASAAMLWSAAVNTARQDF